MTAFSVKYGFERGDVGLGNWRERPFNTWSFAHVSEMVPSAMVRGAEGAPLSRDDVSDALLDAPFGEGTARDFLAESQADSLLVAKGGKLVAEWHAPHSAPWQPHLVFSITKSVTGLIAGLLEADGLLDPGRAVGDYLPEAKASAFGNCTVRDLLDMRVNLEFSEVYLNRDGDYARYRRAMGWNPPERGATVETLDAMLFSLKQGDLPHGGPFHYHSPVSDVLGLMVERVSGQRWAELLSDRVWQPLGAANAMLTVDARGNPRGAGGFSARPEDMLRFGQMILDGGAVDGRQVVPEGWIADMAENGDEGAWATGNYHDFIKGGRYRSQWYMLPRPSKVVMAIGIHGQWLYICPERQVVIVKLASQAIPGNDALDLANLDFLARLAEIAS